MDVGLSNARDFVVNGPRALADSASDRCRVGSPCGEKGCTQHTRERKPYCPDHLDLIPNVRLVMDKIEALELEAEEVGAKTRKARPDSVHAREIIIRLASALSLTAGRLSQDLGLEKGVVMAYSRALAKAGKVRLGKTERGEYTVTINLA